MMKKLRRTKTLKLNANDFNLKTFFKITTASIVMLCMILLIIFDIHLRLSTNRLSSTEHTNSIKFKNKAEDKFECISLFKNLYSNKEIYNPPLKKVPEKLVNLFEQNGRMPIKSFEYKNSIKKYDSSENKMITNEELNEYRLSNIDDSNNKINHDLNIVKEQINSYRDKIYNNKVMVIGSETPWIEILAKDLGASKVITLEYYRKSYEDKTFEWWHMQDYLNYSITNSLIHHVDFAISFSTIQHAGLGRYGDSLSPNGDLEMIKLLNCILKPGGILMIGLPTTNKEDGYIIFNKERVYGSRRLKLLFDGWKIVGGKRSNDLKHTLYIVQKLDN